MSPLVRLHCYPLEDGDFTSGVTFEMEIPDQIPIVDNVMAKLRASYPSIAIRVEPDDDETSIWHVYRDGLPT
jgi:hypothetical protein